VARLGGVPLHRGCNRRCRWNQLASTFGLVDLQGISPVDVDVFVRQLDLIVHERGGLWEPLVPSTVVLSDRTETHGPWPVEACAQVLKRWLDAELIGIFRVESIGAEEVDLAADDARDVLGDPTAWSPGMGLYLFPTTKGENASAEEWRAVLGDASA
jgi:hypothetical protein